MGNTGMDKSIKYISVAMEKTDTAHYPRYELPEGYRFELYRPGMEHAWYDVQLSVEHLDSVEQAEKLFKDEFLIDEALLERAMVFVMDGHGGAVGTACLWIGELFGRPLPRVHWVAVKPEHQGKGLAKAMLTKLLDICHELGYKDSIYLTTQTWSYRAIGVYMAFGFTPIIDMRPANWEGEDFAGQAREAWGIIDLKIKSFI